MDSLFDVLIIFVIIFSIINSIFGKKKQQKKTSEQDVTEPQKKKPDASDILEQIFGLPKPPEPVTTTPQQSTDYGTWNPEDEFKDSGNKHPGMGDVDYDNLKSLEKMPIIRDKKKEIVVELKKIDETNKKRKEIIAKLSNPKSLKDYILFSEILGKPRALNDY